MRVSAKLNLFFGVPEVGLQYLPSHLTYLGSYFKQGRVSLFFYATVAVSSGAWLWLVWQAQQGVVALTAGWVLLDVRPRTEVERVRRCGPALCSAARPRGRSARIGARSRRTRHARGAPHAAAPGGAGAAHGCTPASSL